MSKYTKKRSKINRQNKNLRKTLIRRRGGDVFSNNSPKKTMDNLDFNIIKKIMTNDNKRNFIIVERKNNDGCIFNSYNDPLYYGKNIAFFKSTGTSNKTDKIQVSPKFFKIEKLNELNTDIDTLLNTDDNFLEGKDIIFPNTFLPFYGVNNLKKKPFTQHSPNTILKNSFYKKNFNKLITHINELYNELIDLNNNGSDNTESIKQKIDDYLLNELRDLDSNDKQILQESNTPDLLNKITELRNRIGNQNINTICNFIPNNLLNIKSTFFIEAYFLCYSELQISAAIGGGVWDLEFKELRNFLLNNDRIYNDDNKSKCIKEQKQTEYFKTREIDKPIKINDVESKQIDYKIDKLDELNKYLVNNDCVIYKVLKK